MNTHIQLLRNAQLYTSRDAAVQGMTNKAKDVADGTPILGRYRVEDNGPVYSLLGIVHNTNPSASAGTITILSDTSDINSLKATIDALNLNDAAVDNEYVSQVSQSKGKITVGRKKLPVHGLEDNAIENQFVTGLNIQDGVIKADRSGITTAQVGRTATTALSSTTAEGALIELNNKITAASNSAVVTVSDTTASSGMLKTYSIKQGGNEVGKIDIPKDFLVKSGSVVKGTFAGNAFTENTNGNDTAIKLVINSADDKTGNGDSIYINVHDLVDIYTGSAGDTVDVTVNGYNISAALSTSAQSKLDHALSGVTVNDQTGSVTNNVASVTVDASQVKFSANYAPNEHGVVSAKTSIEENIKALEKAVLDDETTIAASENHLNEIKLEGITIVGGTVNGSSAMSSAHTANIIVDGSTVKVKSTAEQTGDIAVDDTIDVALAKLANKTTTNGNTLKGTIDNVIHSVGLNTDGTYQKTTGATTSAATSTKTAIEALDTAVVANDKKHTLSSPNQTISIVPGATGTTIDVQFDNTSIKQTSDKKFYVDTIDGGTY